MTFNEQEVLHSPFLVSVDLPRPKVTDDQIDSAAVEISPILDEPEYENLIAHDQTATAEIRITNLDDLEADEKIVQEEHIYFAHVNLDLNAFCLSISAFSPSSI